MFDKIDTHISSLMSRFSERAIRLSFAIIFIWFGILKPLGLSAAAPLVLKTVSFMPFFSPQDWLSIIGYWEVLIGIFFLIPKTSRLAILLLFLQMGGTFLPLFLLLEITFQSGGIPFLPTIEGSISLRT